MALHHDFFEMADAILAHVAQTKAHIKSHDTPAKLLIGFSTDDESVVFEMSMTKVRTAALTDPAQNERLRGYLRSPEGRAMIAEAFSKGERIWLGNGTPPEFRPTHSV